MSEELIKWLREPRFELINDGRYVDFKCVHYGVVNLDGLRIYFPLGWRTDMTSVPPWARSLVPVTGAHAPAVLIHDRLLEMGYSRKFARLWMTRQLALLPRVKRWRKWMLIAGVTLFDARIALFPGLDQRRVK